ncbi:hypothetical protein [Sphingomonas sp.]|uniref:hypothetical protein n=1 Tax=Sphingomonas sp. TaxID=28214 RepID=UPI003B00F0A8
MLKPLAALALLAAAAAPTPVDERLVDGDAIVAMTVQGVSLRVRISPGAPAMPVFTDTAAGRARLKGGPFGARFVVGPVKLPARTAVADLTLGPVAFKRRVAWTERPFAEGVDGVIGPGGVPEQVVRFVLGPSRPGERTLTIPYDDSRWGVGTAQMTLGGVRTVVRFDPLAPRTVATAAAAVALAAAHRGTVSGDPAPLPIAFGVERPVRTLTLADPLALGPLTIASLAVRVADGGAANTLREADADPDEVQVVGKGKPGRSSLLIGHDQLRHCSALVFDKAAKQIRLTCG